MQTGSSRSRNWKIFYGDRSTFSCEDGAPRDAPTLNVQVIVQEDPDLVWATQAKEDYYTWEDRGQGPRWWGVDLFGLWEYLFLSQGEKVVLAGRTLESADYSWIWEQAVNDPKFGRKAVWARNELRLDAA